MFEQTAAVAVAYSLDGVNFLTRAKDITLTSPLPHTLITNNHWCFLFTVLKPGLVLLTRTQPNSSSVTVNS